MYKYVYAQYSTVQLLKTLIHYRTNNNKYTQVFDSNNINFYSA